MSATSQSSFAWNGFRPATLPQVPSWVEGLGRAGHIAKGVVYFIMGFLAFKLATGAGGEAGGARNAIREIGQQPYGKILLGVMAIGLFSYTAWRWVQSAKDTEGVGSDAKGVTKRIGYALSGLGYALLGVFAASLALGSSGGSGGESGSQTALLLGSTGARIAWGIVGAIVIGVGLYFAAKGYWAKFMEKYNLVEMSETFRKVALFAGRLGLITRGVAFVIVGGFFLRSASAGTQSGEVSGMGDALSMIAAQTYGQILIGVVGFGLMAYAVHMILLGCYRRFNVAG